MREIAEAGRAVQSGEMAADGNHRIKSRYAKNCRPATDRGETALGIQVGQNAILDVAGPKTHPPLAKNTANPPGRHRSAARETGMKRADYPPATRASQGDGRLA